MRRAHPPPPPLPRACPAGSPGGGVAGERLAAAGAQAPWAGDGVIMGVRQLRNFDEEAKR